MTQNRYQQIIERIFFSHYRPGLTQVDFSREEFESTAADLGIRLPKNLGDLIYSFRFRTPLPESIRATAPEDRTWVIGLAGRSQYQFVAIKVAEVAPNPALAETKIPDATPGLIQKYALTDEQALLAKLRYNRLVDIFSGITCYSLQNHLRTAVTGIGQVETDEIYVGVDRRGVHYVFPIQAKGGSDKLGIVQVLQDAALCQAKFPNLVCRPIAAQFMKDDLIALFEIEVGNDQGIAIAQEKHYRLVPSSEVNADDLLSYRNRLD